MRYEGILSHHFVGGIALLSAKVRHGGQQVPAQVRNLLAIVSGKGGVGKTTLACQLAWYLHDRGLKVGLVDVDVYGPNLLTAPAPSQNPLDAVPEKGIFINSMSRCVAFGQAMMWRGPMGSKAALQLVMGTRWPELDVLIVDFPPGTGDIPMTLFSELGWAGAVLVTQAHAFAQHDAARMSHLLESLDVPVLANLVNLAQMQCPCCQHQWDWLGPAMGTLLPYRAAWMESRPSSPEDYGWAEALHQALLALGNAEPQRKRPIGTAIVQKQRREGE